MSVKGIGAKCTHGGIIKGVGGQPVKCSFQLDCNDKTTYQHMIKPTSIVGENSLLILGLDFMSKFGYTVFDWQNHCISLGENWVYYVSSHFESQFDVAGRLKPTEKHELLSVLNQYRRVFAHDPRTPRKSALVPHIIHTGHSHPHKDKVRRYPNKWRAEIDKQIKQILKIGIIRPSVFPYSSNAVMAGKKDQYTRFCVDYRTLNDNTVKDTYPLPNLQDIMDSFHGSNWFSQVDLASGYWGFELHKKDRHKTAFAAPGGKYELIRMPFRFCNAQATFQRNMDAIVAEVQEQGHLGIAPFVDNVVMSTKTFDEHIATLSALFERLDRANLSLRKDKCELAKKSIQFLGFIVNGKTVRPSEDNIDKINLFPIPKTRRQLQRFLG